MKSPLLESMLKNTTGKLIGEALGEEPRRQREKAPTQGRRPSFAEKEKETGEFTTGGERPAHAHVEPRAQGNVGARPASAYPTAGRQINPKMSGAMARKAGQFAAAIYDRNDATGDADAQEPEPPTPEYMPTVIQNALSVNKHRAESYNMSNIVQMAPGSMRRSLEKIGRDIFSQYSQTAKSLKDVYVVASMVNSDTEVKQMLYYVTSMGHKITDAEYNFPSMPGYKPKAEIWEVEEARFMIVRETPGDFSEEIVDSVAAEDFEQKVDNNECLFYVYGWAEPKGKLDSEEHQQLN